MTLNGRDLTTHQELRIEPQDTVLLKNVIGSEDAGNCSDGLEKGTLDRSGRRGKDQCLSERRGRQEGFGQGFVGPNGWEEWVAE